MPKLYYPNPEQLAWNRARGVSTVNENTWFKTHQSLLLKLANSDAGRDLLCIDSRYRRPEQIVHIRKNMVTYSLGQRDDRQVYLSDCRVGAKWGNVIRYRWQDVKQALDQINLREILRWPRYVLVDGRRIPVVAGGTETTEFPQPDPETATCDGRAYRNPADESWTSLRGGAGLAAEDLDATTNILHQRSGGTADTYSLLVRSVFLFDFTANPDDATLDSGILSISGGGASTNGLTSTLTANVVSSSPASNTGLVGADFNLANWGATLYSTGISAWDTVNYNAFTMNASGLTNTSFTAITKMGVRSEDDVNNVAPGGPFTTASDIFQAKYAETAGTGSDPKYVIQWTAAAVVDSIPRRTAYRLTQLHGIGRK